ncbi:hybrid sensor histidine kinase/response regulator [Arenibaculum pallidiluteum]|uniref:hybrid sensor histidine kinase/response regulator n=1 Tax=Arenibaculum pallidiluteum TaxID=2812559 RepID=UPI001A96CFEF|nr:ATP-binding protein [Arenibaculum pallidiluteum]
MTRLFRGAGPFWLLTTTIAVFVTSLIILGVHLARIDREIGRGEGENVVWTFSQAETDLLRALVVLARFSAGDPNASASTVVRRYDLLWSRITGLQSGQAAKRLHDMPVVSHAINAAMVTLAGIEPLINRLAEGERDVAAEIERRLVVLHQPLRDAAVSALQSEADRIAALSQTKRLGVAGIFALLLGLLAGGGLLVAQLVREARRASRMARAAVEAETEARHAGRRFRDIAEAASDWFWESDADYRLTYISDRLEELSGEKPEAVIGKRRWELRISEDHDESNWNRHRAEIEAKRPFRDFVFPYLAADGGIRYCRVNGKPVFDQDGRFVGYRGTGTDITGRMLAEQALRASEERFRLLVDAHPVPMAAIDLEDGRILFASPPCAGLLRVGMDEVLCRPLANFLADAAEAERLLAQLRREVSICSAEVELDTAAGAPPRVSIDGHAIAFDGRPAAVIAITDLTERLRTEAEIERQREALHQSEKMAALGSLLAGVAHELNNPLSVVVGHASILRDLSSDEATRERASKIKSAADRCARIVKTFLAMARSKPEERGDVQVNAVIDAALDILAYGLRTSDVSVERRFAAELPVVHGSSDQMHQVFMNLIINAQQALQDAAPPRRLVITTRLEDHAVVVELADNGPGIPANLRSRIFDPFFTTKPQGSGTGIGLAVCRGIVLAHGGTITAESGSDGGAIFTVRLPAATETSVEQPQPASDPGINPCNRVLVVDDEPDVAEALAEILSMAGNHVFVVGNGRAALDWIARNPVDAVVSDLRMPVMDGIALYREIAATRPDLAARMIFISGDTLSPAMTASLSETGVPVVEKPYEPAEIARQVAATIERGSAVPASA